MAGQPFNDSSDSFCFTMHEHFSWLYEARSGTSRQSRQIADPQSAHLVTAVLPHGVPVSLSLDTYSIWQNGFIAHENAPDSVKSWRAFVTASPPSSDLSDALEAEGVAYPKLQSKSLRPQFMLWNVHRRKFQLLIRAHLRQQFQVGIYYSVADSEV